LLNKARRIRLFIHLGGVCSAYGRGEVYRNFGGKNLRERDHWGDQGVDGRMILRRISRKWDLVVWTRPRRPRGGVDV
jgi:hypothetical protein